MGGMLRILGPLELESDGVLVALGTPRQQSVLAVLALEAGRALTADRILDAVWGDRRPSSGATMVHTYVHRLRKAWGSSAALRRGSTGYLLDPRSIVIDLQQFDAAVAAARAASASGDWSKAADRFTEAVSWWRGGQPLAGLPGAYMDTHRAELEARYNDIRCEWADCALRLGWYGELLDRLPAMIDDDPVHERLYELQMTALYRSGRIADALSVFDRARRVLATELGVDAGPALQLAQQRMLRRDPVLDDPAAVATTTAVAATSPVLVSRAAVPDGFVGRDATVRELLESSAPVVVIEGLAGAGKTWLALRAAELLADRFDLVAVVNLHGYDADRRPAAPEEVLAALGHMLDPDGEPAVRRARRGPAVWAPLRGRSLLLLLDNAADAEQVRALLPQRPGCRVLVTTRRALPELGAVRVEVGAFDPEESSMVLAGAAGAVRMTCGAGAAREIAEMCGHLPLALGLVAAHLQSHPEWALADHVERLRSIGPDGVQAALALSYENLPRRMQHVFRTLSEHPGADITIDAAAALTGSTVADARSALAALTAEHLLSQRTPGRYEWHDLVRAYAMRAAVEHDSASARHAAYERLFAHCLRMAAEASAILVPQDPRPRFEPLDSPAEIRPDLPTPAAALAWLIDERHNLLALTMRAEDRGWPGRSADMTIRMVGAIDHLASSWANDGLVMHRRALMAARHLGDQHAQADAMTSLARVEAQLGRHQAAVANFRRAISIFRDIGDTRGTLRALGQLALAEASRGNYDETDRHLRDAIGLAREQQPARVGQLLYVQATAQYKLGHYAQAAASLTEALQRADPEDHYRRAWSINYLGLVRRQQGRITESLDLHTKALAWHTEVGDTAGEAFAESNLGALYRVRASYTTALEHGDRAVAAAERVGDPGLSAQSTNDLAETLAAAGRIDDALAMHRRALTHARRGDDREEQARAHHNIAELLVADGRSGQAARHRRQAETLYAGIATPGP